MSAVRVFGARTPAGAESAPVRKVLKSGAELHWVGDPLCPSRHHGSRFGSFYFLVGPEGLLLQSPAQSEFRVYFEVFRVYFES